MQGPWNLRRALRCALGVQYSSPKTPSCKDVCHQWGVTLNVGTGRDLQARIWKWATRTAAIVRAAGKCAASKDNSLERSSLFSGTGPIVTEGAEPTPGGSPGPRVFLHPSTRVKCA